MRRIFVVLAVVFFGIACGCVASPAIQAEPTAPLCPCDGQSPVVADHCIGEGNAVAVYAGWVLEEMETGTSIGVDDAAYLLDFSIASYRECVADASLESTSR